MKRRQELAATVERGLNSLLWLVNNAHNHDAELWAGLVKAAEEDRLRALDALRDLEHR